MNVIDLLAHVLAVEEGVAGGALETPDVPLLIQRNQRLSVDYFLPAARAVR